MQELNMRETGRLAPINFHIKDVAQKGIHNIKLTYDSSQGNRNGENNSNCSGFNNRAKSLIIVQFNMLFESSCHDANFKMSNSSIKFFFNLKNSFTTEWLVTRSSSIRSHMWMTKALNSSTGATFQYGSRMVASTKQMSLHEKSEKG